MHENEIAKIVVNCCYEIHVTLGPGLLESVYEECLCYELDQRGIKYLRQHHFPVTYKEIEMNKGFRLDLLVEDKLVVEIKSKQEVTKSEYKTVGTYLTLLDKRLGLLVNFNEALIKNGIRRIVNNL